MDKMIGGVIKAIDGFLPGKKTYVCWIVALGMIVCQALGYYSFSQEAWMAVGITGMGTWKMSMDRKKK